MGLCGNLADRHFGHNLTKKRGSDNFVDAFALHQTKQFNFGSRCAHLPGRNMFIK